MGEDQAATEIQSRFLLIWCSGDCVAFGVPALGASWRSVRRTPIVFLRSRSLKAKMVESWSIASPVVIRPRFLLLSGFRSVISL